MYAYRASQATIETSIASPFVTAILGPRRVGKSTLVAEYAQNHTSDSWVFLNMDTLSERQTVEAGKLGHLIEQSSKQQIGQHPKLWVAIDEAQKCPPLFEQIKVIYDREKDKGTIKFILTGSGFLSLHQLSAESLAGRIQLRYLREFSSKETVQLQQNIKLPETSLLSQLSNDLEPNKLQAVIREYIPFQPDLTEALNTQLIWGGLPEALQLTTENERIDYLANYLQTYLEKDIRAITTITDLNLYQKMMEIIATQTGSTREERRIIDALNCSRETLKKYRGILEATLIYQEIYPYISNPLKRLVKSPKGYLINNGLISYLSGIYELNILTNSGAIGARFENWFLKELQIWLDQDPKRHQIQYWRTSGNVEVDFIIRRQPDIFPFEVTYSNQIQRSKLKHLKQFLAEEPNAKYGFYLYNGEFYFDKTNNIICLPAWAIC